MDILDAADIGGNALVGKTVHEALVFPGQKGHDVGPQDIGGNNEEGLPLLPDFDLLMPGQDLIKIIALGLGPLYLAPVIKVQAVFRLNVANGLGVYSTLWNF